MKVIICGSRDIYDTKIVDKAIKESGFDITEVVSGTALGIDSSGEYWANQNNIPVKKFPAQWDNLNAPNARIKTNKFGKKYNANAGFDRNSKMLNYINLYGGAVIAIHNDSPGTKDTIKKAKTMGIQVFEKIV